MTRLIALDCETTGLDPFTEELFEVACVDVHTGEEWRWTIEPPTRVVEEMHPKAAAVNRYHERTAAPEWTWDAPWIDEQATGEDLRFMKVLAEIADVLDGAHIIGAVPDFDTRFLESTFRLAGLDRPRWHYHLIDVEVLAVGWIMNRRAAHASYGHTATVAAIDDLLTLPYKSDELAKFCGVEPPSDDERHTALGDARWVARIYRQLTGGTV